MHLIQSKNVLTHNMMIRLTSIWQLQLNSEIGQTNQDVIVKNHQAFGLDDCLGHLDHAIQIPLKPGAKEISLLPFHDSPTNQDVIDKKIDKWIQLEPSKSPWEAPAFIVYQNGKPHMVCSNSKDWYPKWHLVTASVTPEVST